jgi:sec-independent protein translocase protein TatA
MWHLLILLGIILLFFGPSRLPGLGKSLGESMRNFKKGLSGDADIDVTDSAKRLEDEKDKDKKS